MANLYKRYHHVFPSASTEELFTVPPATTAIIKSILVSNPTGGAINIRCEYSPEGTGTVVVVPTEEVPGNDYLDLLSGKVAGPLILEATDVLKLISTAANLNVTVSALLVDRS
jgi:hypothetical protein